MENIVQWCFYLFLENMPWSILIVIFVLYGGLKPFRASKHQKKVKAAKKALIKINTLDNSAMVFSYIRKVDPFVFEEMILTALKNHGHKITRNKKYTGDGGIDGRAKINGQHVFIQAKRYKSHINNRHITEFSSICKKHNKKGLFVHTGITGKKAKQNANEDSEIQIISGKRLLNLLTLKSCDILWD